MENVIFMFERCNTGIIDTFRTIHIIKTHKTKYSREQHVQRRMADMK